MSQFPNTDTADGIWSLKQVRRAVLGNYWPTFGIEATGGTITDITDGGIDYRVHTFTSSGTFEVTSGEGEVEYLVVAGGGGGGFVHGGGGGAGGLVTGTTNSNVQSYPITVGAGGAGAKGGSNGYNFAGNGEDSFGLGITALGGGGGGNGYRATQELMNGQNGGSGGGPGTRDRTGDPVGAVGQATQPTSTNNGFGNDSGASTGLDTYGAGGGGAAEVGNGDSGSTPGVGGAGINMSYFTGSTSLGDDGFFAGGGSGCPYELGGNNSIPGGKGGGGFGHANNDLAGEGQPNTGGGGGASGPSWGNGENGGSGIVVIRYQI